MLIDQIKLKLTAGDGGDGRASFFPGFTSGPDGGNGGKGGDIIVTAVNDIFELSKYVRQNEFQAPAGDPGGRNRRTGKNASDLVLTVPVGSTVRNVLDPSEVYDFNTEDESYIVCKGGKGGKGNHDLKSSTNTTPKHANPGTEGESKEFEVILHLIADIGFIGLPNAGKSSLLALLTAAKPKVGAYPFTTLEPNLGALDKTIIADIPGLIEGAASGKGLGHKFLQHIEKVPRLVHCISLESADVLHDFHTVNQELEAYNPSLIQKPQIILLTKTDLVDNQSIEEQFNTLKSLNLPIHTVSIYDQDSIDALHDLLLQLTDQIESEQS